MNIFLMMKSKTKIIKLFSIVCLLLFSPEIFGQNQYGNVFVTKWAYDKQSAFSFSFDDGFISHYNNVRNILNQNDFLASFYILPPFLTDSLPGIWRYGTWPMFELIEAEGHELGSHTLNHPHLKQLPTGDTLTPNTIMYELYHSKRMIEERIPGLSCITFTYPYGEHNDLIDSLTSLFYESARALEQESNHWSPDGMDWLRLKSYEVHFDDPRNSLQDDLDELYYFMSWIEKSILTESWSIQLAHEVVPFSELEDLLLQGSRYPISNEWLELFCNWLKSKSDAGELWIESMGNITKYIKERDNYYYNVLSQTTSKIQVELTDNLDDEMYNYPLSAYINVPFDWQYVLVEQNTELNVLESFLMDTLNVVMASVTPDNGIISLTKFEPNHVLEEINPDDFILYQNYPNPFNPDTKIEFRIPEPSFVSLKIFDLLGNEISTVVNEYRQAGIHRFNFDGGGIASGIYFCVLNAGDVIKSIKMILLR